MNLIRRYLLARKIYEMAENDNGRAFGAAACGDAYRHAFYSRRAKSRYARYSRIKLL